MPKVSFVIFVDRLNEDGCCAAPWHIGVCADHEAQIETIRCTEPQTLEQTAKQVRTILNGLGYRDHGVTLAIPSSWCLCGRIETADLPRNDRRESMVYRFEQHVPLAAEDMVVDFLEYSGSAMGVCVRTSRIAPIVVALESHGILVDQICPTALLAAQYYLSQCKDPMPKHILMQSNGQVDWLQLSNGKTTNWRIMASQAEEVVLHAKMLALTHSGDLAVGAIIEDSNLMDSFDNVENCHIELSRIEEDSLLSAATKAGAILINNAASTCVNLRREKLAASDPYRAIRRSINAVICSAMVLLITASGIFLWRSHQFETLAQEFESQQVSVYRSAIDTPGAIPLHPRSRLVSEHRRLQAMTGASADVPQMESALLLLREALSRLPDHLRFRILEIRIDNGEIYIDGQARAPSDVDTIASGLRKQGGFAIESPRIEILPNKKGVGFSMMGRYTKGLPAVVEQMQ